MKKIFMLLVVGVAVLLLLSFMPSNTVKNGVSNASDEGYLTLVPVKPPAGPPIK